MPNRKEFEIALAAYGEAMSKEVWEFGTNTILAYVNQLEEQLALANGQQKLPFGEDTHV